MESAEAALSGSPNPGPEYEAGHHWVSPLNFDTGLQQSYSFPEPLTIFDSTLRKILYVSGFRPSMDDMLYVAEALEEAGVREITLNAHWWGEPTPEKLEFELCRTILARGFAFRATVSSDAFLPDPTEGAGRNRVAGRPAIDALRAIGMETMSVAADDPKNEAARGRQLELLAEVFAYGRSIGVSCALALNDIGRMDFEYMVRVANEGIRLGAARVHLGDSYSSLSLDAMRLFVTRFRARLATKVPITMHVHNDFGLASAAAIVAATAGAHPDVAVNGLAYRAGFAALEEVVAGLEVLHGVRTGLRLDHLQRLSDVVSSRIGLPVHPLKPITGTHAFVRDFPTWMLPLIEAGPDAFPPPASCVAPSVVGAQMRIVWGNHHSNTVIRAKLRQMGLNLVEEQVHEIGRRIESRVNALDSYPRWLTEAEVEEICRAVAG